MLNFENDIVTLDAARALCSLEQLSPKDLTPAVSALENFLSSHKTVPKYAALRTLNKLATKYPLLVSLVNKELEVLTSDANRNIATLAITTLLKTGDESNIDKLMKQITKFMKDISDEFRISVVQEMRVLCVKYPQKNGIILSFLSNSLREEGGYDFKRIVVDTIISISTQIKESLDIGIGHLCEFIEDCEYPLLLQHVLHFLGSEGTQITTPSKCIRFIYNRLLLEKSPVRCAAVTTLSKFAAKVPSLRPSIIVILKRVLQDSDSNVRDTAVFFLGILQQQADSGDGEKRMKTFLGKRNKIPFRRIERLIQKYLNDGRFEKSGLDLGDLSLPDDEIPKALENISDFSSSFVASTITATLPIGNGEKSSEGGTLGGTQLSSGVLAYSALEKIPQLKSLLPPLKWSSSLALTEADSDYVVNCTKFLLLDKTSSALMIVFQFSITNKVNIQELENLKIKLDFGFLEGISEKFQISKAKNILQYDKTTSIFVCCCVAFATGSDGLPPTGQISAKLTFSYRNVNPDTGEVLEDDLEEDEYKLEKIPLTIVDYIGDVSGITGDGTTNNFKEEWEAFGELNEDGETFICKSSATNDANSLQICVDHVVEVVDLKPLNDPKVSISKKTSHTLFFIGFLHSKDEGNGDNKVYFLVKFLEKVEQGKNITNVTVSIRAKEQAVRKALLKYLKESL